MNINWSEFGIYNLHVEYQRRGMTPIIGINAIQITGILKGDVVLVKGDNGCGKTSLIRALAGEVQVSGGNIMLDDFSLTPEEFLRKSSICCVPQNPISGAVDSMTVAENIMVRSVLHKGKRSTLNVLMAASGHEDSIQDFPGLDFLTETKLAGDMRALSGGQLQSVNLLSAMLAMPDFVLMDEPTSSIADSRISAFWSLFQKTRRQDLVAIITAHHDTEVEMYSSVVVEMKDNKVVEVIRKR